MRRGREGGGRGEGRGDGSRDDTYPVVHHGDLVLILVQLHDDYLHNVLNGIRIGEAANPGPQRKAVKFVDAVTLARKADLIDVRIFMLVLARCYRDNQIVGPALVTSCVVVSLFKKLSSLNMFFER